MNVQEAVEFLKEKAKESAKLEKLPHNNQDVILWRNSIEYVLEKVFGRNSLEYKHFYETRAKWSKLTKAQKQKKYVRQLRRRRTEILSIIQKYKILGPPEVSGTDLEKPIITEKPKAFISHGKESVALNKLKEFLRALGIEPLVVKEQASLDKTLDDKVNYYLSQTDFVIILATGDDKIEGKLHPRQNVIHEVGLAQNTHAGKIIYLLEVGTEFPSNISPKVWEPFKQRNVMNAFLHIAKELRAYGILRAVK